MAVGWVSLLHLFCRKECVLCEAWDLHLHFPLHKIISKPPPDDSVGCIHVAGTSSPFAETSEQERSSEMAPCFLSASSMFDPSLSIWGHFSCFWCHSHRVRAMQGSRHKHLEVRGIPDLGRRRPANHMRWDFQRSAHRRREKVASSARQLPFCCLSVVSVACVRFDPASCQAPSRLIGCLPLPSLATLNIGAYVSA